MNDNSKNNPVYILDYELISSLGIGKKATLFSLQNNFCGARKINYFDTTGLPVDFAAYVDIPASSNQPHYYDRKDQLLEWNFNLLMNSYTEILRAWDNSRKGVYLGVGFGVPQLEKLLNNEYLMPSIEMNSTYFSQKIGAESVSDMTLTACAASAQAISFAANYIKLGLLDVVLTGGADSLINPLSFVSFSKLGVLAVDSDPQNACTPLDLKRKGTLLGEGSGLFLLVSEKFLKVNKLEARAQILGTGNSLDGYKITAPDPSKTGMKNALEQCLTLSQCRHKVEYINLHGTGTWANDPLEIEAIEEVFGDQAKNIAVSSTKDRHGHLIGGAGALELGISLLSMENAFLPSNRNLKNPLKNSTLNFIQGSNLKRKISTALSCSFAFGGVNSVIAFRSLR